MSNAHRSKIRGTAWVLVASSVALPAAAQRSVRVVDCASLDAEKFGALADDQIVVCEGAARTAGELRAGLARHAERGMWWDEESAGKAEWLETLRREEAAEADALRARMEAVLAQARAGATFASSRDGRKLEELRPAALDLERRMQAARSAAAKERLQREARQLLDRLAVRPSRVPPIPRP